MCSRCYKEKFPTESSSSSNTVTTTNTVATPVISLPTPTSSNIQSFDSSTSASSNTTMDSTTSSSSSEFVKKMKTQDDRTRCFQCSKKVGLVGVECRCGFVYCGAHRYAEKHNCTFDFKTFDRSNLTKNNNKVVAQSLEDKL